MRSGEDFGAGENPLQLDGGGKLGLDPWHHPLGVIYLILRAAVFARQVCLPIPANLSLLTAGALVCAVAVNSRRFR